jgi:hypothetical protein
VYDEIAAAATKKNNNWATFLDHKTQKKRTKHNIGRSTQREGRNFKTHKKKIIFEQVKSNFYCFITFAIEPNNH